MYKNTHHTRALLVVHIGDRAIGAAPAAEVIADQSRRGGGWHKSCLRRSNKYFHPSPNAHTTINLGTSTPSTCMMMLMKM